MSGETPFSPEHTPVTHDEAARERMAATLPRPRLRDPTVAVVMGVSGCGKTTVAALLAATLGWAFQEGDDLHPPENVAKMHGGTPLTDDDRWPWLDRVAGAIDGWLAAGRSGVVTCSALKRAYRDRIIGGRPRVRLVFLHGDRALLARRMTARHEHYMPVALLDSQLATLEPPGDDERPIRVAVEGGPPAITQAVLDALAALDDQD